jgi:hypothetical protein
MRNTPEEAAAADQDPERDSALGAPLDGNGRPGVRLKSSVAHAVHVPKEQVVAWVRARKIPSGRAARRTWYLPAGIEVRGAGAFGVGLTDRDRLVQVDGRAVFVTGDAVEAVLAAVGRQATTIVGVFMRETDKAVVTTTVRVELPELEALTQEEATQTPVRPGEAK